MKRTQNNALCTIIFGKSFKIAMCLFCLIQKKLGHLMTPVIGHLLLLPSEYHSLHGRSQPTNGEFPANSINTAPNLFVTLPFEKKTLKLQKKCSRYFIPYKAPKPWQTSQKSPINEKKHEKPRLRGFQVLLFHGWHPIVLRSGRIELWPFVVYTNNPPWRQQTSDVQHSGLRKGVDFQNLSQQFHVSMDKDTQQDINVFNKQNN